MQILYKMADKKENVVKVIIKGRPKTVSLAAYNIGKKHFGMVSEEELQLTKPIELSKPLIKPTMKPVIIKPPLKVPEIPTVIIQGGDPAAVEVKASVPDVTGDPVTEKPVVKKAPIKRKKK